MPFENGVDVAIVALDGVVVLDGSGVKDGCIGLAGVDIGSVDSVLLD